MKNYFARLLAALLGKSELPPAVAPRFKAEPIAMEVVVDTTDLKATLVLLEQIAEEAKRVNAALDAMRACSASVLSK